MKKIIGVEIHDFDKESPYIAYSKNDCADSVDMEIFDLVHMHENVIHIGLTSGIPIWG